MIFWILAVLGLFFVQTIAPPAIRYFGQGKIDLVSAMKARDDPPPMPVIGARLDRALGNMFEALAVFIPVALLIEMKGLGEGLALTGAMVFFFARVAYVPAYVSNIPGLRSAIWTVGHAGLAMMIAVLIRGVAG